MRSNWHDDLHLAAPRLAQLALRHDAISGTAGAGSTCSRPLVLGRMESLGFTLRDEAWLQTLTQDVVKTSEIEGERLDTEQVRSSIARRLGLDIGALAPVDRHVEGIVEVMLDATQHYAEPQTAERLFAWHGALFPTGRKQNVPGNKTFQVLHCAFKKGGLILHTRQVPNGSPLIIQKRIYNH